MHAYIWPEIVDEQRYVVIADNAIDALALAERDGVDINQEFYVIPEWVYIAFIDFNNVTTIH